MSLQTKYRVPLSNAKISGLEPIDYYTPPPLLTDDTHMCICVYIYIYSYAVGSIEKWRGTMYLVTHAGSGAHRVNKLL